MSNGGADEEGENVEEVADADVKAAPKKAKRAPQTKNHNFFKQNDALAGKHLHRPEPPGAARSIFGDYRCGFRPKLPKDFWTELSKIVRVTRPDFSGGAWMFWKWTASDKAKGSFIQERPGWFTSFAARPM